MVDHTDFISNFREDLICTMLSLQSPVRMANSNVVAASVASSHSLISVNVEDPISVVATDEMEAENLLTNETKVETLLTDGAEPNFKSEGVVLSDSDFSDSDYDIDDDLYEDNVDFDVDEEAKQEEEEVEPDYVLEDEDLNLSIKQKEQLKYKFKAFNTKVDMKSLLFKVGMVFADVVELRKDLTAYSIRNRVQIKKMK